MKKVDNKERIAIIGGGPSALFVYKRLFETISQNCIVDIFEATTHLGSGMPYSEEGANNEHITNVSGNEIPQLITPLTDWVRSLPKEALAKYDLDPGQFNDYKVLPRLLFGQYLGTQFQLFLEKAARSGPVTNIHCTARVIDIIDRPEKNTVVVQTGDDNKFEFDKVIVCTGHVWPVTNEGKVPGYFDSPYPPSKISRHFDHAVAIRGSSLTAIDAIRTLARNHGNFKQQEEGRLFFQPAVDASHFSITMFSQSGTLPAVRFHLDDPHLSKNALLTKREIAEHIKNNDGFLSLDFIFEKDFKDLFRKKDPGFYDRIRNMNLEEFVDEMMSSRDNTNPFLLFKSEYEEAERSIRQKRSVYWKEMLAILSFAMNYPAKHLSAEDMLRLQKVLMPLISIVIAFVPQGSCEELIALHEAGKLKLITVGEDSYVEAAPGKGIIYHYRDEQGEKKSVPYQTFIDCIGQRHLSIDTFPFKSLVRDGTVTPAKLRFRNAAKAKAMLEEGNTGIERVNDANFYLEVPGIAINDHFQVVNVYGVYNPRIYIMAVPYIGGYNPDYSGLDFCEASSKIIVERILAETK